jgi:hypothetical protein
MSHCCPGFGAHVPGRLAASPPCAGADDLGTLLRDDSRFDTFAELAEDFHMDDIRRARSLAATFEFSPYIWYPNPIIGDIRRAIGEERMKRWIPVKDALGAGALSVPGSDWSVVPSVNPWLALETLVTRQVPGGGGEVLGAQESISLQQAFDMFTMASARHMNMAHVTGSIEAGKRADLIIVDQNIFEVPITKLHETRVLHAFIDGEEVYSAR